MMFSIEAWRDHLEARLRAGVLTFGNIEFAAKCGLIVTFGWDHERNKVSINLRKQENGEVKGSGGT